MSRRVARVSEAIREVASEAILFELKDPRVRGVTVTGAQVTGDLRNAKIFVSLMGESKERALALAGLKSARGFLQRKVADRLETRYTPVIEIVEDDSVKKSLEMARILREVLPATEPEAGDQAEEIEDDGLDSPPLAADQEDRTPEPGGDRLASPEN